MSRITDDMVRALEDPEDRFISEVKDGELRTVAHRRAWKARYKDVPAPKPWFPDDPLDEEKTR